MRSSLIQANYLKWNCDLFLKNKPGNLKVVNILQWHKVHSGIITSEESFWEPKHINRFSLMISQQRRKDIYFRFIVTLWSDIPIFVVYAMIRKSLSFCYFFRFKIWVLMYIWRKFIWRGQSSTQWFSPGGGRSVKWGLCPQARAVYSLHCFCEK